MCEALFVPLVEPDEPKVLYGVAVEEGAELEEAELDDVF